MKITVIEGPNLNMLGIRERAIYGAMTLNAIHEGIKKIAEQNGVEVEFHQSNIEGELIDRIQECYGESEAIILNAAAYSHTSIALRDAIAAVSVPTIEVHLSNTAQREEFRHKSPITAVCAGIIAGFGPFSYHLAMIAAIQIAREAEARKNTAKNSPKE
ncbi:MAG: type II 3-dehydroquinate dehydratase [Helicobacteraceae bacterium]|nr:type II 3-dehydroquinate dehydratase [Helicobacteraceae bacterium]